MAKFLMSPGVIVTEQDQSSYVVTAAATKVAMTGYASKGPVDTPVLCISAQDYIDKFGLPPANNPYMGLAALKYFEEGNTLLVTRLGYNLMDARGLTGWSVAANEVEDDEAYEGRLQYAYNELDRDAQDAALPAITGTKAFAGGLTYSTTVDFTLKYYNPNDSTWGPSYEAEVSGSIGGIGVTTAADLATELNNLLSTADKDYFLFSSSGNYLLITMDTEDEFKDSKATLTVSGTGGETTISQLGFLDGNRSAYGVGDGAGLGIGVSGITIKAKTNGTWGNDISVRFYSEAQSSYDATLAMFVSKPVYKAGVYYKDQLIEEYSDIDWEDESATNYVETLFPTTYGEGSDYVSIEFGTTSNPTPDLTAPDDIADDTTSFAALATGADGVPVVEGTMTAPWANALNNSVFTELDRGINTFNNSEIYEFDVVLTPGQSSTVVINGLIGLVNSRRDCMAIIDPPFGLNHEDVADWHNGTGSGNTAAFNTSYAALYWPWLHDYDPYNKQYIWLPPSGYVARQYVYTDSISDPWKAPAGMTRGKITALDVEQSASQTQRDLLYGEMNAVNPIVNFVGEGITIWGQKTLLRDTKATNRVNVRRLLIYAERLIAKMAKSFVFDATDETSWADFTRKANAIIEPIRIRRGLYSYKVVMDSTTNTAVTIDQNKMVGYIFLQPTKTAEFIEVYFTITATGETFVSE